MPKECPGMNPQNWKFDDIQEYSCIHCGKEVIEFWKGDVKRICPSCGKTMYSPNLGNICLSWCKKAEDCLGNMDINEWKQKKDNNNPNKSDNS